MQHQLLHGSTSSSSSSSSSPMFLQVPDEQYDHRILKEVRQVQPTIDEE